MWSILLIWVEIVFARPLSETLMYQGRVEEALAAAHDEAAAHLDDVVAQERWIDLLLNLRLAGRALAYAEAHVSLRPDDPNAHYLVGRADIDPAGAQRAYERALRLAPDHARSHMGMAALHLARGKVGEAEAGYRTSLSQDPTLTEASQGLARILAAQRRIDEALAVARASIAAVPDGPDGYLTVAVLDPGHARTVLLEAVGRAGDDPRIHARLADVYLLAGDADKAANSADRALAIDPRLKDAALAKMYADELVSGKLDLDGYRRLQDLRDLEATDREAALDEYRALTGSYPDSALVWMGRSRQLRLAGDAAGALADLATAVGVAPGNAEAVAAYGLTLMEAKRPSEAKPLLARAVEARPLDASLAVALARSHWDTGDPTGAIAILQRTYARFPYDVSASLEYARALSDHGESLAAYRVVRDSAQRIPDPRLTVAFIAAARDVGRYEEAADLLEAIGTQHHSEKLIQMADELRTLPAKAP